MLFLSMLCLSLTSFAEMNHQGQWYVNPMIGYQWLDGDRDLDDDNVFGIGLEYQYNERWAAEIKYLTGSYDGEAGNDADVQELIAEGMYHLTGMANEKFKPYLAAGLGHADFDYDGAGGGTDTRLLVGPGMRYALNDKWSTKADLRWVTSDSDASNEALLTLALSYALGKKASPAPAPAQPLDSDGDGVVDSLDQCPNTAAGIQVNARGCELDDDRDGVVNSMDACPGTAAGAKVDAKGCALKLTFTESISLNVTFASNSSLVEAQHNAELAKVARFMKSYPTVSGVIEGHTDDTGKASYNMSLSQRRADAIVNELVNVFGVAADRLSAKGYGEEQPVASNDSADGRQQNRRVVAVFEAEVTK